MGKRFTMLDEGFTCQVCRQTVAPLGYTARDHCPHCLSSLHVDHFPGDRSCACRGILEPIGMEKSQKGYKIIYRCQKCGEIKKNIAASDDDMQRLIELSAHPVEG